MVQDGNEGGAIVIAAAREADIGLLFLLLVLICAGIGVYFVFVQNYVGAVVAVFIAIVLAVFLL